ncbi:MAG: tetratricopeptide repeat protein, partial [Terracidiphilus sp.]
DRKKKQLWTTEQELEDKEGKLPSVAWTTFKNWEAIGAWYRSLEGDRALPSDAELQAKVVELTAGKTTQQEKVRALYAYVSTQIRYIGVDFGIGRVQPHYAAEVLQNQYGDCKDKHTLLAAMLSAIDLHPDAVLIGAGIHFNEAVPSPQSFNHLITRVSVEGQTVWLDSTAEVAPYRVLAYVIRDKKALIVPDSGIAAIDRTPANLPFRDTRTMDAVGTLDDTGTSNSHLVLTFRGDNELLARAAFHHTSAGQYDDLVQRISQSMGYAGTTSHAEVSRPEDTTDPFKISYDYKREKAGDWDNRRIVPQVAPVNLPRPSESDPPVRSISLGTLRTEVSTSAMKIPNGWFAATPDDVHIKSPWVTYDETYHFEKDTVYAERKIEILQEKVPVADWKTYKKFADDANLGNEKFIQLRTSKPIYTPIPSAPTSTAKPYVIPPVPSGNTSGIVTRRTYDPKAAQLIAAARLSIQHHEFEAAQSQLDEARSINPEQPRLWTNYGYLEFQRGNMTAAIPDYRKELALYPDNYGTYTSLAEAQNILGQEKDAQETLRNWAAAQPDSPRPVNALVSMLLDEGHASEAAAAAEAFAARLPETTKGDQSLQLLAGRAQLAAGMKQKGEATLLALLRTTTDPGMMNNAAYELADAGLDLDLVESTAKAALARFTVESRFWTPQGNSQNAMADSRLITAAWDTLGWILYREGKIAEAENYIQPAWLNEEHADMGEHLGEIAEAKGNREEALRLYELGLAAIPSYLRPAGRKAPGATQNKLTEHIDALRKAGVKEPAINADEALLQLRTISIGASGGLAGTAEYRLLLGNGEVLDVQKISDKDVPTALERIKGVKIPALRPNGSEAQLVRNAILNCHAGICELVLEP